VWLMFNRLNIELIVLEIRSEGLSSRFSSISRLYFGLFISLDLLRSSILGSVRTSDLRSN